jgi:hypothetical protein
MADYVTNTEISRPLQDPRLQADVDLNGLKFSYQFGIFYEVTGTPLTLTMPPPWSVTQGGGRP